MDIIELSDYEVDTFGQQWVGPTKVEKGEWTLVAFYPSNRESDGYDTEVWVNAIPARFWRVVARATKNSGGETRFGFMLQTGTGPDMRKWVADTARLISQGLVDKPISGRGRPRWRWRAR